MSAPGSVKKFNGRDTLLRVRDGEPHTDAEHRVRMGSGSYAQPNLFTVPLSVAGHAGLPPLAEWNQGTLIVFAPRQPLLSHALSRLLRGF